MPIGRVTLLLVVVTVAAWSAGYGAACAISPLVAGARATTAPVATPSPAAAPTATPEASPPATATASVEPRTAGPAPVATATAARTSPPPGLGVITITAIPTQGIRGTVFVLQFSGFPASASGTDATMTVTRPDQRPTGQTVVHAGPNGAGTAEFRSTLGDPSGPYFIQIQNGGFNGQVPIQLN